MINNDVFAIGDIHGHPARLAALLSAAGLIDEQDNRLRPEVTVVSLGDLGHFGMTRDGGPSRIKNPSHDFDVYKRADEGWIDILLWGNHDRAVVDFHHIFGGYYPPYPETLHLMRTLMAEGKYRMAYSAHGFLMTHAGVHPQIKHMPIPDAWKTDPVLLSDAINALEGKNPKDHTTVERALDMMVNAISNRRGGPSPYGGLLWRDASEHLHDGFRQIFGHTSKPEVRRYYEHDDKPSYCIDVGNATNGSAAGIWLPSEEIVIIDGIYDDVMSDAKESSTR